MNNLVYPIIVPIIAGIAVLIMPGRAKALREALSVLTTVVLLVFSVRLFIARPHSMEFGRTLLLYMDNLSGFVTLFIAIFSVLIIIYSLGFMRGRENLNQYYGYLLMTIGASIGAVLANDLIFFITCWGFLGITLYLLIGLGGPGAAGAAKKALIIVGGADALMILGIAIIWMMSGTFSMREISLHTGNGLTILAYLSLACGAFAKGGAMPFHTWIPASSEAAPTPVMGFLPAALDKLLAIYFLARVSLDLFLIKSGSLISIILLAVGAITILGGVMMALVQHNLKRLLAYHTVSQVGYMVLGIGTGNPIGIAGGLFHMLNNSIYKYGLFLCAGAVEKKRRTTDLDSLGGLSRAMPITYISCLVAALAISGVPPLNGFVSKWLVYQGLFELGKAGGRLWVIWFIAAIFGSALTLASFMKLMHAVFLGQSQGQECKRDEVGPAMWVPMAILAVSCVIFGVFAYSIPIKLFIAPSISGAIYYPGVWNASLSTGLILVGIVIGLIIYAAGNIKNIRVDEPFIGGEALRADMKPSGVEFYKTIEELPVISGIYKLARIGAFDIYNLLRSLALFSTRILQRLHNGVLPTYLAWCMLGVVILFFALR